MRQSAELEMLKQATSDLPDLRNSVHDIIKAVMELEKTLNEFKDQGSSSWSQASEVIGLILHVAHTLLCKLGVLQLGC